MTHEYDDPITPDALAEAAHRVAERYRLEERELEAVARDVVRQSFCSCVGAPPGRDGVSILDGLVADVSARARALLGHGDAFDRVDEASIASFPASDAPAWTGGKPTGR